MCDRVNRIWNHAHYQIYYKQLRDLERERIYCGHDLEHFLAVARLMWIKNLEQAVGIQKDLIYGLALLHDIGRVDQYRKGIPHEKASAEFAEWILPDCGYSQEEIKLICEAILHHRRAQMEEASLGYFMYEADKQSRLCLTCPSRDTCNWPEEKMNLNISE